MYVSNVYILNGSFAVAFTLFKLFQQVMFTVCFVSLSSHYDIRVPKLLYKAKKKHMTYEITMSLYVLL